MVPKCRLVGQAVIEGSLICWMLLSYVGLCLQPLFFTIEEFTASRGKGGGAKEAKVHRYHPKKERNGS